MVRIIPEWLQEAVNFLNKEFPEDKDVTVTVLYGYDCVGSGDELGFAVYNTDAKSIYIADPSEIRSSYDLNLQDAIESTLMNLFHEYRHHQQNTYGWELSEDDAEHFAKHMYKKFVTWTN